MSIRFADFTTTATIGVTTDFSQAITDGLDSGFEAAKRMVEEDRGELEAVLREVYANRVFKATVMCG